MSIGLDAETGQGVALGSEVLLIGGASGVPDKQRAHGASPERLARSCRRTRTTRASGGPDLQKDAPTARPQQPARPTTGSVTGTFACHQATLVDARTDSGRMTNPLPLANVITFGARDFGALRGFYRRVGWPQVMDDDGFAVF